VSKPSLRKKETPVYEFIKTEKGWTICWGAASLFRTDSKVPVVRTAETASAPRDEPEPVKVLSA
jgi:hypothetical protein